MITAEPSKPRASWYLVHTKPRQEQVARENLARQGYEVYLPLLSARRAGRGAKRVEPMFPRYLFVRLTAEKDNFAPIRSTLGVARMVRFGDRYAVLPDELVTVLAARGNSEGVIERQERELARGERVVIRDGVLAGYEAIFAAPVGKQRIALLLEIADRQLSIETTREAVSRVL